MTLHVDIETCSDLDLKKVGVHRYAEDPSTRIILEEAVLSPHDAKAMLGAHNAVFERVMLNAKAGKKLKPEDMSCTLARAAAVSLPLSLGELAKVLKAPVQKDEAGRRLMLKMCRASYQPKEGEMERLRAYCRVDVETEMAVDRLLPELSARERRVWLLDQGINDRGFAIDVPLVEAAIVAVHKAQRDADNRVAELTGGAVTAISQVARIVKWLNARGIPCESLKQDGSEELLTRCSLFDDPAASEVVGLRLASSRAFKFQAMLDCVCQDGRVRGTMQYHGAISGRWTGRLVQPQNFKRIEDDADAEAVETILKRGPHGASLDALSLIARPCIVASKGRKLIGGDFSNIEGRVNAWINGEDWKLAAFMDYDAGAGPDLYEVMAAEITRLPKIDRTTRQIWGKVPELACGYQGGVNAFHKMGGKYGVKVDDKQAKRIVAGWRERNPAIVAGWHELQSAAIQACEGRGAVVHCLAGRIAYRHDKGFLWCKLPSGRVIAYPGAVVERKLKVVEIDGDLVEFDNWGVSYWGQVAGGWRKIDLYGGAQMAHVVSGTARDILVDAMFRLEAAGYPIILTVHDETLSEVDAGFGSAAEYQEIMAAPEPWFAGLPVVAKAWEGARYAK